MRSKEAPFTQKQLREMFHYNPDTGDFNWLAPGRNRKPKTAGWVMKIGYVGIHVLGKAYYAHRLAWFYMTGEWPREHIDHINGDPTDNRFCNLREATNSQNNMNRHRDAPNSTGFKGVYLDKRRGTYYARVQISRCCIRVGPFATAEAAHEQRLTLVKEFHGEFARLD